MEIVPIEKQHFPQKLINVSLYNNPARQFNSIVLNGLDRIRRGNIL